MLHGMSFRPGLLQPRGAKKWDDCLDNQNKNHFTIGDLWNLRESALFCELPTHAILSVFNINVGTWRHPRLFCSSGILMLSKLDPSEPRLLLEAVGLFCQLRKSSSECLKQCGLNCRLSHWEGQMDSWSHPTPYLNLSLTRCRWLQVSWLNIQPETTVRKE